MNDQLLNALPADIWNHILPFTYKCPPLPVLDQIRNFDKYELNMMDFLVDLYDEYPCSLCVDFWTANPRQALYNFTYRRYIQIYPVAAPVAEPPKKIQYFKPPKLRDMHPLIKKQKPLFNCKQMKKNNAKYKKSHR
jgi:hypothetical protein